MLDLIAKEIAATVKESVQAGIKAVMDKFEPRMKAIEERFDALPKPEKGDKGDSVALDDIRPIVTEAIDKAVQNLKAPDVDYGAVKTFISEEIANIPPVQDGKSITVDEVWPVIDEAVQKAVQDIQIPQVDYEKVKTYITDSVAEIPPAQDGKSITVEDVLPIVEELVDKAAANLKAPEVDYDQVKEFISIAVAEIPKAQDGKSVTLQDVSPLIEEAVAKATQNIQVPVVDYDQIKTFIDAKVAEIPPAQDGKSVTLEDATPLLKQMVDAIEIPVPEKGEDGKSVTLDDVRPIVLDAIKSAVAEIPVPKDGEPGRDAAPVDMVTVQRMIDEAVNKAVAQIHIPEPKQPQDGRDALDIEILAGIDPDKSYNRNTYALHKGGLWRSFERTNGMRGWETVVDGIADIQIDYDGERGVKITTEKSSGEIVANDFTMPIVIDRGVYKEDQAYMKNDGVTFGGSFWIAQKDNAEGKPGDSNSAFRLAVKRGRDANTTVKVK